LIVSVANADDTTGSLGSVAWPTDDADTSTRRQQST
jgi:hypothetical protein